MWVVVTRRLLPGTLTPDGKQLAAEPHCIVRTRPGTAGHSSHPGKCSVDEENCHQLGSQEPAGLWQDRSPLSAGGSGVSRWAVQMDSTGAEVTVRGGAPCPRSRTGDRLPNQHKAW